MNTHPQPNLLRRLTNPAAEFIENHHSFGGAGGVSYVGEVDAFLDEPDIKAQEAKSTALWNDVEAEKAKLFKCIDTARTKWNKKFPAIGLIHPHVCTWSQVMKEFSKAEEQYRNGPLDGRRGRIKRYLRRLSDSAPIFERWVGLLPSGDYGSGICGAFRLVLSAASRIHDIRECVYEALSDIPEAIRQAEKYVDIYKNDDPYKLKQETVALYKAIIITLQKILGFFTRSAGKRAIQALVHQENYEETLTLSVRDVKERSVKIKELATECSQERQGKMDEKIDKLLEGNQMLRVVLENLHRHLLSHPALDRITREPITSDSLDRNPKELAAMKSVGMNSAWLIDILDFDAASANKDIVTCRAMGGILGDAAKDRASFVANSAKLQKWLTNPTKSQVLIVNNEPKQHALSSCFSFLCAEISYMLGSAPNTYTIAYFCGLHADSWRNPRANARGMMVSLLGQLLCLKKPCDLSFMNQDMTRKVKDDDIRTLCRIFRRSVLQLPEGFVLFCCIDTISIYETSDRLEETRFAFRTIARLLAAKTKMGTFKVLITSPGRSLPLEEHIDAEDILQVPDYIDGNRSGIFDLKSLKVR